MASAIQPGVDHRLAALSAEQIIQAGEKGQPRRWPNHMSDRVGDLDPAR
jgi:hypothetical protein